MIHNGHKVLLSNAILKANSEVVCGVTTGEMNKSFEMFKQNYQFLRKNTMGIDSAG